MDDSSTTCEFQLPGFRFHPTEEELLNFYLKTMVFGKKLRGDVISFVNIYNHDPRELPGLAKIESEREWYFFVPRDRKHGSGGRPNRTTEKGFWKATGSDRKILSITDPKKMLGLKKTLVFYEGRAPRGRRTDWIMNEYRLPDTQNSAPTPPKDMVLCKIYRKATSLKVLEQRAAMEAEIIKTPPLSPPISTDSVSFSNQFDTTETSNIDVTQFKTENNQEITVVAEEKYVVEPSCKTNTNTITTTTTSSSSLMLPNGMGNLLELHVPPPSQLNMDWTQDSFWTQQLRSPWLDNFVSFFPMC